MGADSYKYHELLLYARRESGTLPASYIMKVVKYNLRHYSYTPPLSSSYMGKYTKLQCRRPGSTNLTMFFPNDIQS